MKTQPDETTLTLWMDGELEGDELARIEAWAQDHPELLVERDAVQQMSASIRENVPASVEPPYADFFNQRILRHIDEENAVAVEQETRGGNRGSRWQQFGQQFGRWLVAPVAAGAMLVCFYVGTKVGKAPDSSDPYSVATVPTVYTPDGDVSAAMFKSEDAGATVIVLEGLEDIPDDFEMVGEPSRSRSDGIMVNTEMTF